MFSNEKSPAAIGGDDTADDAEAEALRVCARQLLDAVAAEPVPERLRSLALALEQALERQRIAASAGRTPETGEAD